MGLATCSLAWDWASRAVGLIAVRRAVNIFVVFVVEDGVIKRGDRSSSEEGMQVDFHRVG
jgi:hypothetical protein